MAEEMVVTFPGNLKVRADINDMTIETDQPEKSGGDNSAPSPFTLFTASLATCAGYFALKFCRSRKLETEGMKLTMKYNWDSEQKKYPVMELELTLPDGFPAKYSDAIVRAIDQCAVKKHIVDPPEIQVRVR
ncbi:MAG: OsmC family protein [Desulfocapsaceae bacterium]|nr:OsmC family protein [Desulfocapsaceae bacterium]